MAEIIGLAASVATLAKVTKVAVSVIQMVHDAPPEVRHLTEELVHLSSHTRLIREMQASTKTTSPDLNDLKVIEFERSLAQAESSLERISASLERLCPKQSARSMIRWTLLKRESASRLLNELHATRAALNTSLTLALCLEMKSRASIDDTAKRTRTDLSNHAVAEKAPVVQINPDTAPYDQEDPPLITSWSMDIHVPYLSGHSAAALSVAQHRLFTNYGLSFTLKLPYGHALSTKLVLRRFAFSWACLSPLSGSLVSICNLVDQDCEFFDACCEGNLPKMRYMLGHGLAKPNDVSMTGLTPIWLAVESGKVEAVQLLLDQGIEVDTFQGLKQTTPLAKAIQHRHLDIARLLLSYNASCGHITGWGFSPLFYLWNGPDIAEPAGEFLELLAARQDFRLSHLGIRDIGDFGVIHRASALGHADDVVTLIKLGVNPYAKQGQLGWNAIQNAVFFNRYDVFNALLPYFEDYDINTPDTRGWTLLHISASEGHDSITRHLLEMGADWQAVTQPWYADMAEELYGRRCTPADVAMGEGGEEDGRRRRDLFLRAVQKIKGIDCLYPEEEVGIDGELWCDALESIPVS